MANNDAILASLLLGQRQRESPLDIYRKFGQQQIQAGSSTAPLGSGNPLEGIARALQGGIGGLMQGYGLGKQQQEDDATAAGLQKASVATTPQEWAEAMKGVRGSEGNAALGQIAQGRLNDILAQQQAGRALGPLMGGTMPAAPQAPAMPQQGGGAAPGIPQPGYAAANAPGQVTLAQLESGGDPKAVNPQSGATGLYQFLPGTAADVRAHHPELNLPEDFRSWTPEQQGAAQQAFQADNAKSLTAAGHQPTPANLYLAHRLGAGGAQAVLSASPDAPLSTIVPPSWIEQNPDMRTTVGQFVAQANQRFPSGGQAAPGRPGAVATPPAQGSGGGVAMNQPGPPTAMSSPAGDQLRQRATAAQRAGDNITALKFAQQAAEEDAKWATEVGKKNLGQGQETVINEQKIREQFDQLQPVKDYRKAATVFRSAIDAAKANTAAADLNLVYAFATMMDPGSVVREGEMGMVRATQSAPDQIKALVNSVSGGARISPEARANLLDQMSGRYESMKGVHDALAEHFGGIADRSGMNRQNVVVPLPPVTYQRPAGVGVGSAAGAGEIIYGLDGKPVKR